MIKKWLKSLNEFQLIVSEVNFDFNMKISFFRLHNEIPIDSNKVSLINFAAYFSAVKIYKYNYLNTKIDLIDIEAYALAGGCYEIIRI